MTIEPGKFAGLRIWLPAIRAGSGADVFTLRLADALRRAGHEPLLQWFDHRYELMPWRLKRALPPPHIDLVHAGSWQGFAFKRAGIPLVVTEHQYVAHPVFAPYRNLPQALYHRLFAEQCAKRSYAEADAIVAVSEFCAVAMRKDLNKPIEMIHNWVDTTLFSPNVSGMCSVPAGEVTRLLFIGNPSRRKGADVLPALATMLGERFEIRCLGGLRKSFKQEKLPSNMRLLSSVVPEGMPDIYRSVDIVVIPTRYEPFGYVALEAMACGLPVVGFDSTGTAEICEQGKTALLAPVDDVAKLADYIRQLACEPNLRAQMGLAGRQRAVKCFSEAPAIMGYLSTYERVLKSNALTFGS